MKEFRPVGRGPLPIAKVLGVDWWTMSNRSLAVDREERDPDGYSASTTRESCACKVLGQGGCATPQEAAPVQDVPGGYAPTAPSQEGPSPLAVVGAVGVVGLLGLVVAGVI